MSPELINKTQGTSLSWKHWPESAKWLSRSIPGLVLGCRLWCHHSWYLQAWPAERKRTIDLLHEDAILKWCAHCYFYLGHQLHLKHGAWFGLFLIRLYHHKVAVAIINTGSAALGNIYISSRMLSTFKTVYQSENTRVYLRSKSFIYFFNQSRKVSHTLPKTIALICETPGTLCLQDDVTSGHSAAVFFITAWLFFIGSQHSHFTVLISCKRRTNVRKHSNSRLPSKSF